MQAAQLEIKSFETAAGRCDDSHLPGKLKLIPMFKNLNTAELAMVSSLLQLEAFEIGEELLTEGQPVSAVYFIEEGLVDILVNNDRVSQRGHMDSLGEMSCLSGEKTASATVRAITACQVWKIDRSLFLSVIDAIPMLRSKMISTITSRLQHLSHRFSEILKHIPHGIVKIDLNGVITDEFSSRCIDYLGIQKLTGESLGNLLYRYNEKASQKWDQAIDSFATDTESSLNARLASFPEEVTYLHPDGSTRIFRLFYHVTVDDEGQLTGLDIGIDDITLSRQYQSELSSFQNMMAGLEQLLVLFEAGTGLIVQESISNSQLGQVHFPTWKSLKGNSILESILKNQAQDQLDHFRGWLGMLQDQFILESMSVDELIRLAPRFVFETISGKVLELTFTLNSARNGTYNEVLGKFEYLEAEPECQDCQELQTATMDLMEEVMAAEAEHQSSLPEALNEMQLSLEFSQSRMTTPNALVSNHRQIAAMIHSVKGLGQSFGLNAIAQAAHELEEILTKALVSGQNVSVNEQLVTSFRSLLSLIVVSKSLCNGDEIRDLGISRSREPEIRIPLNRFKQINKELDTILGNYDIKGLDDNQLCSLKRLKEEMSALEAEKLDIVFPRLHRIIQDTAGILNKRVEFRVVEKAPVLLDRKLGHRINTCLIQMVKNAVYHGVESPSERKFLGKPEKGIIELTTEEQAGCIIICVRDDGQGINVRKTVDRALKNKQVSVEAADKMLDEKRFDDVFALLFQPGFSTATSVTLTSGRGIGMHMIKTEMEAMGGSVSIDSVNNGGTRVCLSLPSLQMKNESVISNF